MSALLWRRIRGLWKLPDGKDWLRGKLGLVVMAGAMFNKSLIQFSVGGWGWWVGLCSLPVIYLRPNYGGGNEDNGNLLQKVPCKNCYTQCPQPCSRPPLTQSSARDSWTLMGNYGALWNLNLAWRIPSHKSVQPEISGRVLSSFINYKINTSL